MGWLGSKEILALNTGARIHVEIDGTIVSVPASTGWLRVQDEHGIAHHVWVSDDPAMIPKVALAAPDFWPPRKGDIWEARETEYFCHECSTGIFSKVLVSVDGDAFDNDDGFREFLALGPRLVRRNQ